MVGIHFRCLKLVIAIRHTSDGFVLAGRIRVKPVIEDVLNIMRTRLQVAYSTAYVPNERVSVNKPGFAAGQCSVQCNQGN